ncbi:hypothetical protein CXB48_17420 [Stutzerimonas stutzeri]|nr:hypothetical protein CXB48_17420 [Stutzerimonas stutzeri]
MFSCSKIEQKQLNTWVSFQSAEQPLLGQFSVSGNSLLTSASSTGCATFLCNGRRLVTSHFANPPLHMSGSTHLSG